MKHPTRSKTQPIRGRKGNRKWVSTLLHTTTRLRDDCCQSVHSPPDRAVEPVFRSSRKALRLYRNGYTSVVCSLRVAIIRIQLQHYLRRARLTHFMTYRKDKRRNKRCFRVHLRHAWNRWFGRFTEAQPLTWAPNRAAEHIARYHDVLQRPLAPKLVLKYSFVDVGTMGGRNTQLIVRNDFEKNTALLKF